jgi:hypothetical protein
MSNRIRITVPRYIWSDERRYKAWIWETYGRYIWGSGTCMQHPANLDLQINLRWW